MRKIAINKNTNIIFFLYLVSSLFGILKGEIFKIIDIIITLLMLFKVIRKRYITVELIYILFLTYYMLIVSLFNKTLSITIMYAIFKFCIIIFYIVFNANENLEDTILGISMSYNILILINAICFIVDMNNDSFFLGGKNALQMKIVPCIALNLFRIYKNYKHKNLELIIIISIGMLFISNSSTAIVIAFISIILMIINKFNIVMQEKVLMIAYGISFFMMIILRKVNFFDSFIKNFLKKDLTFTGRTYIWDYVMSKVTKNPLLGYGRGNQIISSSFDVNETHNFILEIIFNYGFIGFLMMLFIINKSLLKINQYQNRKAAMSIFLGIFLYFIIGLTESIAFNQELWSLIAISFELNKQTLSKG